MAGNLKEFLSEIAIDPKQLGAFIADSEAVMRAAELSDDDIKLLNSGNLAAIYARITQDEASGNTAPTMVVVADSEALRKYFDELSNVIRNSPAGVPLQYNVLQFPPLQITPPIYPQIYPQITYPNLPLQISPPITPLQITPQFTPQIVFPQITPLQFTPFSSAQPQGFPQLPPLQLPPTIVFPQITPLQVTPQVTPQIVFPQITPLQVTPQITPQVTPQIVFPQFTPPQVTPQIVFPQITPLQVSPYGYWYGFNR